MPRRRPLRGAVLATRASLALAPTLELVGRDVPASPRALRASSAGSMAPSSPASSASRSPTRASTSTSSRRSRSSRATCSSPTTSTRTSRRRGRSGSRRAVFRGPSPCDATSSRPASSASRQHGPTVNTVVFDLGGVLVDWDPRYLLRKVMPGREAEMETILPMSSTTNGTWRAIAGDSWPDAMAAPRRRSTRSRRSLPRRSRSAGPRRWAARTRSTVAVLRELRERGVPLYALSNWSAQMFPHAEARFDWLTASTASSSRAGCAWSSRTRPSTATCWTPSGWPPADIFFIDDHEPNVLAARALGMYAHHFRDAARAARGPRGPTASWSARRPDPGRKAEGADRQATTLSDRPQLRFRVPSLRSMRASASRSRVSVSASTVSASVCGPSRSRMSAMRP